jgi:hypothetical protein
LCVTARLDCNEARNLSDRFRARSNAALTRLFTKAGALSVLLAALAGAWHAFLMTSATNDNFLHLTLAKQWLAGDWPVRDFFDQASILQYAISAVAQTTGGDRLLSEAIVVGLAWSVSTYVVFELVRRLTGYTAVATLAALLLIMAGARGYSYPKGVVYAVAATLWWRYVQTPTVGRSALFGAWAAVAFYFRADHGIYVAAAVFLACLSTHGFWAIAVTRCLIAGAIMLALVSPFFGYVQATLGLAEYVETGVAAAQTEHVTQGPHEWPLFRFGTSTVVVEPADTYAPTIAIRWASDSSADDRRKVLGRYELTPVESEDGGVQRVRLSARSIAGLRSVINEAIVADTAGVDRSTATLSPSAWLTWERWKFNHAWLRLQVLPTLDSQARASEIAVALFYALPVAMIAMAPWLASSLSGVSAARELVGFATFALLVDAAMLRLPFTARMGDAVVLSAVVFGCCVGGMWRMAALSARLRRSLLVSGVWTLTLALMVSITIASGFANRISALAGGGTSLARAQAAWRAVFSELVARPPLSHFVDQRARFSLRLAAYVRACVPETERLLVLWFEPEIFYYGDRLMAQRHLVFAPTWTNVVHEQRLTLEKIKRYSPPVALARRSALDGYARASYPGVVDYVEREYRLAATIEEEGEEYLIFAQRARTPVSGFGSERWPCFAPEGSLWSRVGHPLTQ